MGGKAKQTQRTKNNARPSNSGRSAELLGSSVPLFVGFSAHSGLGIVPVAPGFLLEPLPETFDSNIDPQYQLVFRKMSKKDPVTKTKALQEFVDLVKISDIPTMKAVLPLWPKFYHSVANDIEHRVREASQQAQMVVVEKVGKNIAPVLKQLVPVWITSQFDAYAPAANLASQSFTNAFPANKLNEVFVFCQSEVMDYLVRNIVVHSPATLCNSKGLTEKEIESKYERIISSNLRGYALFLTKVTTEKLMELEAKHQNILQSKKFWNFSKHDDAGIRAAWFECLSSILQSAPGLLTDHKQHTVDVVFLHIADTDPSVLPQVWSCVLLIQEVFEDWYNYANFKKVIIPKLSLLLENGGFGNATVLCPHYLPFISKLSEFDIEGFSLEGFYDNFFDMQKVWLTSPCHESVVSKSEITANTSAYFECLRYVIQKKAKIELEYSQKLIEKYVCELFMWSIENDNHIFRCVFTEISNCVNSWSQNATSSTRISDLAKTFWESLSNVVQNLQIDECDPKKIDRVLELIVNLNSSEPKASSNRVKFSLDSSSVDRLKESNSQKSSILHHELKPICINLSRKLIAKSNRDGTFYVVHLKKLFEVFHDIDFYKQISDNEDLNSTLKTLQNWLSEEHSSETLIDMIFEILNIMESNERMDFLTMLLEAENMSVQQWTLQRLLSYPLCLEPDTRKLLSQKHVSDIILKIARNAILENSKDKLNLLQKCFFQNDAGEILIDKDTVYGIINIVSEPLTNQTYIDMMDTCASFVSQAMPVICSENSTRNLQREVFLKLFVFTISMNKSDQLSEDTLWEISTCWQDAISSGDVDFDEDLLIKCTTSIQNRLQDPYVIGEDVIHVAKMTTSLLSCVLGTCACEEDKNRIILMLLGSVLPKELNGICNKLENYSLYIECLHDIFTPTHIGKIEIPNGGDIKLLFTFCYYHVSLLYLLTCDTKTDMKVIDKQEDADMVDCYEEVNEKVIKLWTNEIYEFVLNLMKTTSIGLSLVANSDVIEGNVAEAIANTKDTIDVFLDDIAEAQRSVLEKTVLTKVDSESSLWIKLLVYFIDNKYCSENKIHEKFSHQLGERRTLAYIQMLQVLLPKLPARALPVKMEYFSDEVAILFKITTLRVYIQNYFSNDTNCISDKKIVAICYDLINEVAAIQKTDNDFLLYKQNLCEITYESIITVAEVAKLLTVVLNKFPMELGVAHWDFIRIALSSWILMISKAIDYSDLPQVSIFVSAVYKLHSAMFEFFTEEKQKSSTLMLTNVIDEWDNLFAIETTLVVFKTFYSLLQYSDKPCMIDTVFYDIVCPRMEQLDYGIIMNAFQKGFQISLDECMSLLLDKCSHEKHSIRIGSLGIIRKLLDHLVKLDTEKLEKRSEVVEKGDDDWHWLSKMHPFISKYTNTVEMYLKDFSYKGNEITELSVINRDMMMGYLLLWDSVILACSKASPELRSFYAQWITANQMEQPMLQFLIRSMPVEILKNFDSKIVNTDMFKPLEWIQIKDKNLLLERYACHLYAQTLRHLPAVVRKWWNESNSRQKTFVDKLTTNYVSHLICQEELRAITSKKEKHENMQITVHTSTREVIATYSIDEAKMELVISLALNHPLGTAKIESEKQIGGRLQSRVVVRQLTIFLTHQNGSIFDVLSLWKKNLDKKFEGVEECYVCYSVIHQDTCQLPKLSCKTCRKKFHGPCLYKWFTTSSKSTCPICRNVF